MRTFISLLLIALLFASCGTSEQKADNEKQETQVETVQVADFEQKAPEYAGKKVSIEGTVVHVCKHGGKRMFIMSEDPDKRVKILSTEQSGVFNAEMEGSDVRVTGIVSVQEITKASLAKMRSEAEEMTETTKPEAMHSGEEGHEHNEEAEETLMKVENWKKQLDESNKDKLTFYSIDCQDYTEL
ncbi:MAG: hypothetical protein K9I94_08680 [Bacteroidales bacterium]|nr:hypothetical protein [Bacteroidales bacterium]